MEVTDLGPSGLLVECAYRDKTDIEDYLDLLEAAGFAATDRALDQNGDLLEVTVADGSDELRIRVYPQGRVDMSMPGDADDPATPDPGGVPAAPVQIEEFPEWLPPVPGGALEIATESSEGGFTAIVTIEGGHTVTEYVGALAEAGFVETGETMPGGFILDERGTPIDHLWGRRRLRPVADHDPCRPLRRRRPVASVGGAVAVGPFRSGRWLRTATVAEASPLSRVGTSPPATRPRGCSTPCGRAMRRRP